jgi:hypothetical protein
MRFLPKNMAIPITTATMNISPFCVLADFTKFVWFDDFNSQFIIDGHFFHLHFFVSAVTWKV